VITNDKNTLRQDRTALIQALEAAGAKITGNTVRCPFHDDHRPSAGVYRDNSGIWRYKCQSCGFGGDVFDVRAKIAGSTAGEAIKQAVNPSTGPQTNTVKPSLTFPDVSSVKKYLVQKAGEIVLEHTYADADGDFSAMVFRCESNGQKTYRPISLTDKGYALKAPEAPRKIYNLPAVVKAESVIIAEGEKCADILNRYGFTVTTSMAGAKNAKHSDWRPVAGKAVTLWPDNDTDGKRYMADVQEILQGLSPAPRVSYLDPSVLDLAEKEDAADFVGQLNTIGKTDPEITCAIAEALKKAKPVSVSTDIQQRIAEIKAGRYACIDWHWENLNKLTQALLPGAITLLVGNPGASKSFMALEAFSYWDEAGLKCSLFEAEEDKTFHLTRALAQKSRQPNLTDTAWVKEYALEAERIATEHRDYLESFGRAINANPDTQVTLTQLSQWVETQAKAGCRIIGIDPVTAAERGGDAWVMDGRFLQAVKRTATDYRCSIILVTHPIKAVSFPDLSQVAGSAAYQRFSQTILWLESHDTKESKVKTSVGTVPTNHNRTLHILKARNGKGMGLRLAYQFDPDSLTLRELGIILKDKGGK
jgi:hypothetical protein